MSIPVWTPENPAAVAALLSTAARDRLVVAPRGAGTKLSWMDRGDRLDAWISMAALTSPLLHDPGDMVATLPAGLSLAEANRLLARAGQWLPLDPPAGDHATVGGILASNDSGPRRHRYGAPRDLILGVEAALTDGTLVNAGGRVVKNVAGYDLSRLLCGSHGQLAIITSATFKLAPLSAASRTLVAEFADVTRAADASLRLSTTHLTPSAVELAAPSPRLLVRFESSTRAADAMAADASALLGGAAIAVTVLTDGREEAAWAEHEHAIWGRGGTVARLSVLPTQIGALLEKIGTAASGTEWSVSGRSGLGVLHVRLGGAPAAQTAMIETMTMETTRSGGRLTLLQAPDDIRRKLVTDGDYGDARALMRSVKAAFDPDGVLAAAPALCSETARS